LGQAQVIRNLLCAGTLASKKFYVDKKV